MNDPASLRRATRDALAAASGECRRACVGLDGARDTIMHVVDTRHDALHYDRIRTIDAYARRIAAAAGKSANLEWAPQQVKLGGNAPLMGMALGRLGTRLWTLGALGWPKMDPIFAPLLEFGEAITCAGCGLTDAAEFDDGKIMYGQLEAMNRLRWEDIVRCAGGEEAIARELAQCQLVALTNWTMLPHSDEIYKGMARLALEAAREAQREPPMLFFDFADPAKRSSQDLKATLELIAGFAASGLSVTLGLNHQEALQVASVLGLKVSGGSDSESIMKLAAAIHAQSAATEIVVHPRERAAAASASGACCVEGPFTSGPKLSTGAGDHFNGGYCHARLRGLASELALVAGCATSGFYVRNGAGPTLAVLLDFLDRWAVSDAID